MIPYRVPVLLLATLLLVTSCKSMQQKPVLTGSDQSEVYLPLLRGKKIGLVVNQTSVRGNEHLVDYLLRNDIKIATVFAPEHGFRGTAEAGETVKDGTDLKTGLKVISLYGANKKPSPEQLSQLDILVFDIQDVGTRFYTYISTMHYIMEAGAENNLPVVVLDRPNPNSHYVDGPILEKEQTSFVGMHPIPIVHGLTVGELARMINGEGWLAGGRTCNLTVVPVKNWTRGQPWSVRIAPSPNLPNDQAIRMYPALCLFEGTNISVGRGTPFPFQVAGSPELKDLTFTFTPVSIPGVANKPPFENEVCRGIDFRKEGPSTELRLDILLTFFKNHPDKSKFFIPYFERLAGTRTLREQILAGKTEAEIRASWQPGLSDYLKKRKPYLLY